MKTQELAKIAAAIGALNELMDALPPPEELLPDIARSMQSHVPDGAGFAFCSLPGSRGIFLGHPALDGRSYPARASRAVLQDVAKAAWDGRGRREPLLVVRPDSADGKSASCLLCVAPGMDGAAACLSALVLSLDSRPCLSMKKAEDILRRDVSLPETWRDEIVPDALRRIGAERRDRFMLFCAASTGEDMPEPAALREACAGAMRTVYFSDACMREERGCAEGFIGGDRRGRARATDGFLDRLESMLAAAAEEGRRFGVLSSGAAADAWNEIMQTQNAAHMRGGR